jgi:hypothetical protein
MIDVDLPTKQQVTPLCVAAKNKFIDICKEETMSESLSRSLITNGHLNSPVPRPLDSPIVAPPGGIDWPHFPTVNVSFMRRSTENFFSASFAGLH